MTFKKFVKDQWFRGLGAVLFALFVSCLLAVFKVPGGLIGLTLTLFFLFTIGNCVLDYERRKRFYQELSSKLESLDQKYLVMDMLEEPDFLEGKLIYEDLISINKSMTENVKNYQKHVKDYKDFVEMWVHEIKLPIASLTLMLQNLGAEPEKLSSDEEKMEFIRKSKGQLARLDSYAELVLYYVRSENAAGDFSFSSTRLQPLANAVVLKNKDTLLEENISFQTEGLDVEIMTDSKWMEFILNQLVSNAIKYRKKKDENLEDITSKNRENLNINKSEQQEEELEEAGSIIEIFAEDNEKETRLHVRDNGIGIAASNLPRVFEKSFTGENGRSFAKATGMGLYIVKSLCQQMGYKVSIDSKQGEYTDVCITIGKNETYKVVKD